MSMPFSLAGDWHVTMQGSSQPPLPPEDCCPPRGLCLVLRMDVQTTFSWNSAVSSPFSPFASWINAVWRMLLFISASFLKAPVQFKTAKTVMANQLISYAVEHSIIINIMFFHSFSYYQTFIQHHICASSMLWYSGEKHIPCPSRFIHKNLTKIIFLSYQYVYPKFWRSNVQKHSDVPGPASPRLRIVTI